MRRQELIYAQADGFARNKDILNISTSSDICVFESPVFDMTGATKIVSGTTEGVHWVDESDTIALTFNFTDNLTSLESDTMFSYTIYRFDNASNVFTEYYKIASDSTSYGSFSATNVLNKSIVVSGLTLDGQFLIKPTYEYKVCTDIFGAMGLRHKSGSSLNGGPYYLYNPDYDYYFAAVREAEIPNFELSPDNNRPLGTLSSVSIIPSGETAFTIDGGMSGLPIVTLNGLTLAVEMDYSISGNTIILNGETLNDDIINIFYVGGGGTSNGMLSDTHVITMAILSGTTGNQGDEFVYFNITSGKYELYLNSDPIDGNNIIVSINGAILANNIDYYQSPSDKRRLVLEGEVIVGDIVNVVYNGNASYVGGVTSNSLNIYWSTQTAPQNTNGVFVTQLSTNKEFSNVVTSATTPYVKGIRVYNSVLPLSGSLGDKLYYRVVNTKNFTTIAGDVITSVAVSEVIPIIIQSNLLNKY